MRRPGSARQRLLLRREAREQVTARHRASPARAGAPKGTWPSGRRWVSEPAGTTAASPSRSRSRSSASVQAVLAPVLRRTARSGAPRRSARARRRSRPAAAAARPASSRATGARAVSKRTRWSSVWPSRARWRVIVAKSLVAELHRDGAAHEALAAQPARDLVGQAQQRALEKRRVGRVRPTASPRAPWTSGPRRRGRARAACRPAPTRPRAATGPTTPKAALRDGMGARARSPTVMIPSDRMRTASFGPTPHNSCTSSGQNARRNASSSSAVSPRGFSRPAAILATSLFGPAPTETPSPNRSATARWTRRASSRASSSVRDPAVEAEERLVHAEGLHLRRERQVEVEQLQRERDVALAGVPRRTRLRGRAAGPRARLMPASHARRPAPRRKPP